jgi:hypothetical protein
MNISSKLINALYQFKEMLYHRVIPLPGDNAINYEHYRRLTPSAPDNLTEYAFFQLNIS